MSKIDSVNNIKWYLNIYGELMNGNIVFKEYDENERLNKTIEIQEFTKAANDQKIDDLLNIENWRSKLVAGYLIGFKNRKNYTQQIGELLLKGCGGATGYCYALARFADEESTEFLIEYLDQYLQFKKFPKEQYQDWAMVALKWVDKINGTSKANSYLEESGLWYKFVNFKIELKDRFSLNNSERWGDLEKREKNFERMMLHYEENFEEN